MHVWQSTKLHENYSITLSPHAVGAITSRARSAAICGMLCNTCNVQETASTAAKTGSGLWVGPKSAATVSDCTLTGKEAYGVESSYEQAKAELKNCTLTGNGKAETDTWQGGKVSVA